MQIPPFTLNRQYQEIGSEIESEVSKVLKGGQYIGGQEIAKFEESFSNLIGVENTIGCNSGTDALVLALRALDIGVGDEVITSSFSFFATAEAISAVGADPILVDIDPETYLINTELIEQEINTNTKAIMPVHLFGNAVNMTLIKSLANKYDLKVIEDCAQATCTMWKNSKVGSIGDIGCFSFFPTKNLGAAGDGGAVTTSDQKIAKKIRELAVHGSPIRYHHTQIGYNSRLDTIQAAILNIKIKYISQWINNRQKIAKNYLDLLEKNPFISFPKISSDSIS
ncbi:DegT/DnrJ/EryC1/StrS family aminotransferase, partial [Prochlorococcus sp. AH-736-D23]|nr:DegT/DnrJ/EryC1/StrS family aminotransferase [Prochlorococcus sp. AH-736-D23]